MTEETTRDDQRDSEVIERLLDEIARGEPFAGTTAEPEAAVRREYLEVLGLLGASTEPMEPPPAIRERLLAQVGAPVTAGEVSTMPPPAPAPERPSALRRWALPLAASLAVALAGVSSYQATELAGQRATIEDLSRRLEQMESRTTAVEALRGELASMRGRLALITGRGVEICALKPTAKEPWLASSRGVLYVAADHQHWYLTLEGLMPSGAGESYQLWFVPASGRPVSAGTFDVGEGVRVELSSDTMPEGTRAVTVTLEPAGGSQQPTGPAVLHGDEVMAIL